MSKGLDKGLERYLTEKEIWPQIFDSIRLVEQNGNYICRCRDGHFHSTGDTCYSVWGKEHRCENCVSRQAYDSDRQRVKIEYADGNYFLVIARPVQIDGMRYVIEFITNMTHQLATGHDSSPDNFVMELIHQLENVSSHDAFSGLFNKKYLTEKLTGRLTECKTSGKPLYVALWDIDKFKKVNDTFGHDFGDRVLLQVAKILRHGIPQEAGAVCRFGGDEFVIVFAEEDKKKCLHWLEAIKKAVDDYSYVAEKGSFQVTVSYGFADVSGAKDFLAAMHLADAKMYASKHKRR